MRKIAKKRRKRKISKKALIYAIVISLIVISLIFIDTLNKLNLKEENSEKAELSSTYVKTTDDIYDEYKIKEESKIYNEENKLEIQVNFNKYLYENNESNKEYFESVIKDLVKVYKTDFVIVDKIKNIKIEVIATSENNYTYTINNIENYFEKTEEKNSEIKNFKEISSIDEELDNKEIKKFDANDWSVKAAGVKIQEYGDGYLKYNNYKVLTDNIYINTIVLEENFEEEILEGIKVGTSKEEIKEKLGDPTFEEGQTLGYKTNDSYIFFYDNEVAIYPNTRFFNNKKLETIITDYINLEKQERNLFARSILKEYNDFKSYIDNQNNLNLISSTRGISIKVDENKEVQVNIYNNYDLTEQTKNNIREEIFNSNFETDLIFETEKNRK